MSPKPRVFVRGSGIVSSLGETPQEVYRAIQEGGTGFSPGVPFGERQPPVRDASEGTLAAVSEPFVSGEVRDFDPQRDLGDANFRPLDRTGRLAAVACSRALGATGWRPDSRSRCGLVLGTYFGGLRTIAEFDRRGMAAGPLYVKPFEFANSVINAAAGQSAIWHHLEGPNATVCGGLASGVQAIGYAADLLRSGRIGRVLAGGAEEFCFETYESFREAGYLSTGGRLDLEAREGTILGEGAAFVALEASEATGREPGGALAEILGFGEAFDPSQGTDPEMAGQASVRALRAALMDAGQPASAVEWIAIAANGMPAVDRPERDALREVFGPHSGEIPMLAVKAALGECLGASGGQQLVVLVEAMTVGALGVVNAVSPDGHTAALVVQRHAERD